MKDMILVKILAFEMYMIVTISFAYFLSVRFMKSVKDIFIYTLPYKLLTWIITIPLFVLAIIFIKNQKD